MKILAIDQAAKLSGWSFWENDLPVEWGIIEPTPKNLKGGDRLHSLKTKFKDLIDCYCPDIVVIEDPVGGEEDKKTGAENNWKTMQILCQVQGVLLELISSERKCSYIISPSSWQNICGIHARDRNGRKTGAKAFVEKVYNISNVSQDIYDSICIGYCYLKISKPERSAF